VLLTVVYGVLVIGAVCLVALAGLELVQRLVPATSRQPHNDVAGFIYAALGVIYAVLLALVVIAVWEEYNAAGVTVEQEANALAEIFWLAHRLPEPEGTHIQELARSYAEEVSHKEWPLMEQGQTPLMTSEEGTPAGWTLIDEIRANLQEVQPRTQADVQLYAEGLDQVQRLADARRMRLVAAEEGVPAVLWAVLIFGGIAAVSFTYLFGLENTWAHRLMVVTLAAVIGLVLFTIGALEHPFSGGARIEIRDQQAQRPPISSVSACQHALADASTCQHFTFLFPPVLEWALRRRSMPLRIALSLCNPDTAAQNVRQPFRKRPQKIFARRP
jgi:hypothetical protein